MSKELEKLEYMASAGCITDHDKIDKVIRYVLSLPFSYFVKDKNRFNYLNNDLCLGFNLDDISQMSLEDMLVLFAYEPGNPYFDPPDAEKLHNIFGKGFNTAGDSYVMALMLNEFAGDDIHIKEFLHIELFAYTEYLTKKVKEDFNNNLISANTRIAIMQRVDIFKRKTCEYLTGEHLIRDRPSVIPKGKTMGELISKATKACGKNWQCHVKSLNLYFSEMVGSYDILNRLFMDAIKLPMIYSDRERFKEILMEYRDEYHDRPVSIDYEVCYEYEGGIKYGKYHI